MLQYDDNYMMLLLLSKLKYFFMISGRLGTWAEWGSWGECDVPCGGGIQRRERMCEDGEECIGLATQSQRCNRKICPRVGKLSSLHLYNSILSNL